VAKISSLEHAVYLISRTIDAADDLIALELNRRDIAFFRFNVDEFPFGVQVGFDPVAGTLQLAGRDATDLINGEARVWTRGLRFQTHSADDLSQYVVDESLSLLCGIFACSSPVNWMNHPEAIRRADYKAAQLRIASRLGMAVPKTLLTNDSGIASMRIRQHSRSITKPVSGRLIETGERLTSVYTAPLGQADLAGKGLVPPFCAQERLDGEDIRVTIVGRRVFAVSIKGQSDIPDWRLVPDVKLEYKPVTLTSALRDTLLEFMGLLGLRYAAIDLYHAHDTYYFLELNPGGQWAWLEHACGLNITETIVDELVRK
jgi:hypothetical protein